MFHLKHPPFPGLPSAQATLFGAPLLPWRWSDLSGDVGELVDHGPQRVDSDMAVGPAYRRAFMTDDFPGDNVTCPSGFESCSAVVPQAMEPEATGGAASVPALPTFLFLIGPFRNNASFGHEPIKLVA